MTPAQAPTTADMPLWLVALCLVLGLGTLAWMIRAWFREWQAYRAGTLLPHHKLRPVPPTIRGPRSPWRFLIYVAQAGVIAWATFGMARDMGWGKIVAFLAFNTILVAFGTAVLTRLWDLSRATLARWRAPGCQR